MQKTTRTNTSETEIKLEIVVNEATLVEAKKRALAKLSRSVKITGFREGKAPASLVEKSIDPNALADEFLNEAVNLAYPEVIVAEKINPVARPIVTITKVAPYTTVEFTAIVTVIGEVKLADYKNLKSKREVIAPDKADIEQVIGNMQTQLASKKDVERAAANKDQVWINFAGKDSKGEVVKGATGDNYPLVLGSNTFIPGFEEHLVGLKAGDDKEFTITFPGDYGVKALQSKKVTFACTVLKVQEVVMPELDAEFVKKVAPQHSTIAELREDIKTQLAYEADGKADRAYENALVGEIVAGSTVALPKELIDEQAENVKRELAQTIVYRGQTMEEYLQAVGMTAEEQNEKEVLPEAERRLKAGVLLSDIADAEKLDVSEEEINMRVTVLKQRYASDAEMLKQIDGQNGRRELGSQILTEKTVAKIISYQK
jgi:trigger factor